MSDTLQNAGWNLGESDSNGRYSWEQIHAALLRDIRQELRTLNARLSCSNLGRMQRALDRISAHVSRLPKKRKPRGRYLELTRMFDTKPPKGAKHATPSKPRSAAGAARRQRRTRRARQPAR